MITIVSGLPRSGTSMMMQMLEAGGLVPLVDNVRKPDEDNPKGYYELEAVKTVKQDDSWLDAAEGRAFKMVYLLLYDLPPRHNYSVIFMERDLGEVVASQNRMLERLGRPAPQADDKVTATFRRHIDKVKDWLDSAPGFRVLYVNYNSLMRDPGPPIAEVNSFLGGSLDTKAMLSVIDTSLYRQKKGSS